MDRVAWAAYEARNRRAREDYDLRQLTPGERLKRAREERYRLKDSKVR